jgi:hypothetical protein
MFKSYKKKDTKTKIKHTANNIAACLAHFAKYFCFFSIPANEFFFFFHIAAKK